MSSDRVKHEFAAEVDLTAEHVSIRFVQGDTGAYLHLHIPQSLTEEQMQGYETMVMELHETVAMMLVMLQGGADSLENDDPEVGIRVEMVDD